MEILNDYISVEEIIASKAKYQLEVVRTDGNVGHKKSYLHAESLTRSTNRKDVIKGIKILEDLGASHSYFDLQYMATLIFAYIKIGKKNEALETINEFNELYPSSEKIKPLERAYDERFAQEEEPDNDNFYRYHPNEKYNFNDFDYSTHEHVAKEPVNKKGAIFLGIITIIFGGLIGAKLFMK